MKFNLFILAILLTPSTWVCAQGFINLNFESASIVFDSSSSFPPNAVYASNAIPGWTAYIAGNPQTDITYNDTSLGAALVSIHDTNDTYPRIQGVYFILLQSATQVFPFGPQSAAIGQTSQIPLTAMSMTFWGLAGGLSLSFAGQSVSFAQTGIAANYNIYTANISPFSGQTGELLFTAPFKSSGRIDNIIFSTQAVPEPSALALLGFGIAALSLRRLKSRS